MDLLGLNQVSSSSFPTCQVPKRSATLILQKRRKAGELPPLRIRSKRGVGWGSIGGKKGGVHGRKPGEGGEGSFGGGEGGGKR